MVGNWALKWMTETDTATSGPIQTSHADNLGRAIPKAWIDVLSRLWATVLRRDRRSFSGKPMKSYSYLASMYRSGY